MVTTATLPRESSYVGGHWEQTTGPGIDVFNPATEDVIGAPASASADEVDHVMAVAEKARRAWARQPGGVRGDLVRGIGTVIRANRDALAALIVQEVGKPLAAAYGELDFSASICEYMAGWDRRIEGEIIQSDFQNETIHLMRVPVGVVAAITAWNFPIALFTRKVAPALVTGNSVVVKPSEIAPLSTLLLMRLIDEQLNLPEGVLNVVTGDGTTGHALTTNPRTNMVTFTGHRDTGKRVMTDAAARLTRVSLELGGKAPAIVLADANLDVAVKSLVQARFGNTGQVCTCAERTLVHESIFDEFVGRYTAATQALRIGDPMTDVDLGPVVSRGQYDKALAAMTRATGEGATIVTGGKRPAGASFERGYWVEPTILVDVDPSMEVMREEVFGPIMPIAPVSSLEQALEVSNDTNYGLSAYVFTDNYRDAMRAANELDFGELYINRTNGEQVQAHHSGHKESGLGGEDGKHGVLRYTQVRTVYHRYE